MARCSRCGKNTTLPYFFEDEALCDDCAGSGGMQPCVDCGHYFNPEDLVEGRCQACADKSED